MLIIAAVIGLVMGLVTSCGATSPASKKTVATAYCTAAVTEFTAFPDPAVLDPRIRCSEEMECEVEYYVYRDGKNVPVSPETGWCTRVPFTKTFAIERNQSDMPRLCRVFIWAKDNPAQRTAITINQYGSIPIGIFIQK
ncbi:MAG: hypothetical protein EOM65_04935 [Synergistales bacterium]|nr:hypothetical protein [Synergistales bacterium]